MTQLAQRPRSELVTLSFTLHLQYTHKDRTANFQDCTPALGHSASRQKSIAATL